MFLAVASMSSIPFSFLFFFLFSFLSFFFEILCPFFPSLNLLLLLYGVNLVWRWRPVGYNAFSGERFLESCDPPSVSVVGYIERHHNGLGGQRISVRLLRQTYTKFTISHWAYAWHCRCPWTKRCSHSGERGATNSFCCFSPMHSPNVRCFEELMYEKCLGNIFWWLDGGPF